MKALKSDGTLWSWGYSANGEQGNDTNFPRSSPIQIPGTTWCCVAGPLFFAGGATKTDNTMWTWGFNGLGALGDNTVVSKSSPIQIPGTNWREFANYSISNSAARKTDNTFWRWGNNNDGIIGNGLTNVTTGTYSSPIQIPGCWIKMSGTYSGRFAAIKCVT
jgi:alpha-tubulin suppressor-like RCC1 family protein